MNDFVCIVKDFDDSPMRSSKEDTTLTIKMKKMIN